MSMRTILWIKRTIGVMIGSAVGIVIGFFVGANLGGNYFGDFVFNGSRGYEATGQIGVFIGGLLGAICGYLLSLFILRRKRNRTTK